MEKNQQLEWAEAQSIVFTGGNLVVAVKQQLEFLAAVDRRRCLYSDGPVLRKAIYRYKNFWLPLLTKHGESSNITGGPLVVPLDCEWIWHCHRLNPTQYKQDCEDLYGRVLDSRGVESTTAMIDVSSMEELWGQMYPNEPFELDYDIEWFDDETRVATKKFSYDLVAAVGRQSSFYYQVSRPVVHDDRFLEGAVARYKGFLHLTKKNLAKFLEGNCVPTYDIDIIWHSHQLQPVAYCNDTMRLLGKVLVHDDTDSDLSAGGKLDVTFTKTTKQWESTFGVFGMRYWRAGAMYRGEAPSHVTLTPLYKNTDCTYVPPIRFYNYLEVSDTKFVEVLLQIVNIRNAPDHDKMDMFVSFGKDQPDMFLDGAYVLNIESEIGEKQFANFQCEPTGNLIFSLLIENLSPQTPSSPKTIGTTSISLKELMNPDSELVVEKWFELEAKSENIELEPIYLHIAASFTVPISANHVFNIVESLPSSKETLLSLKEESESIEGWSGFVDGNNSEFITVHMRHSKDNQKQVRGVTRNSRKVDLLAKSVGNMWYLIDSSFSFSLEDKISQDGLVLELVGGPHMRLYPGRKLELESGYYNIDQKDNHDFITVIMFTKNNPYGKSLALVDLKSGVLEVTEEWFVFPGMVLAYVLVYMMKTEGHDIFVSTKESECSEQVNERKKVQMVEEKITGAPEDVE